MTERQQFGRGWKLSVALGALCAFALGIWAAGSWRMETGPRNGPAITQGGYFYHPGRGVVVEGLVDHHQQPFRLEDWRGHWLIVNFGYLSCPDICPVTLAILNEVFVPPAPQQADLQLPEHFRILYVTVDPERDKPEMMREYLSYFGDFYLGITGSESQLTAFGRQLNAVFVSQKKDAADVNYTVSHSSSLAFINPQGEFVAMLKGPDDARQLRQFLREVFAQGG